MEIIPSNAKNPDKSIKPMIEYLLDNVVYIDLPNILTLSNTLRIGMPYLYHEGQHFLAIRLLHLWDEDGFVYLKVQDLQKGRVFTISCKLEQNNDFSLWSLASWDYLIGLV